MGRRARVPRPPVRLGLRTCGRVRLRGATPVVAGPGYRRTAVNIRRGGAFAARPTRGAAIGEGHSVPARKGQTFAPGAWPVHIVVCRLVPSLAPITSSSIGVSGVQGGRPQAGDGPPLCRRGDSGTALVCSTNVRSGHGTWITAACTTAVCPQVYLYSRACRCD